MQHLPIILNNKIMTNSSSQSGVVLVHPHFDPDDLTRTSFFSALKIDAIEPVRESLLKVTYGSQKAIIMGTRNEILHRFYRKEVDRISKNPKLKLLIVRDAYDSK